ncbi:hypothetical protein EGY16_22750 [Burkholderia pseudomallei]|nr:hypothetical protein EGY16_22750 [Burkholderia pseudomallei]
MAVAHRDIVAASMGPACRCPLRARRHGDHASAMRNAFRELAWSAFHCRVRNAHRSRYEADTKPIRSRYEADTKPIRSRFNTPGNIGANGRPTAVS